MIWQLIRRDVAWRWMPWLFLTGVTACVLWHFSSGAWDFISLAIAYCVFSLTPSYAFNRQIRDVHFQASLPITVRQIYVSWVLSMLALFWLTVGIGVAFGLALSHPAFTRTLLDFGSLFTTALMAIQSAAVQCKLRKSGIYVFNLFWAAGVGACAISGLPGWLLRQGAITAIAFPVICWTISAGIFLATWQALPKSFDFAPRMLPAPDKTRTASRWRLVTVGTYLLQPFWLICYFGCGLLWASKWFADSWFLVWTPIGFGWAITRWQTRWLLAFPVSPRAMLAGILLPTFLIVCGGYETGLHIAALADTGERGIMVTADSDTELTNISKDCRMFNVLPPNDYLVPARPDKVPLIRAPWGETFQPGTNPIDGFDVYNPYASGCDNTERFLDWQFMRATTVVYGHPIPRNRNAGPYLVTTPMGIPGLRRQLVTLGLMCAYMMLLMLLSGLEHWHRLQLLSRKLRFTIVILACAPLIAAIARFDDISQWAFWALPGNPLGAVAVAIFVLAAILLALDAAFRRTEFVYKAVRARL